MKNKITEANGIQMEEINRVFRFAKEDKIKQMEIQEKRQKLQEERNFEKKKNQKIAIRAALISAAITAIAALSLDCIKIIKGRKIILDQGILEEVNNNYVISNYEGETRIYPIDEQTREGKMTNLELYEDLSNYSVLERQVLFNKLNISLPKEMKDEYLTMWEINKEAKDAVDNEKKGLGI